MSVISRRLIAACLFSVLISAFGQPAFAGHLKIVASSGQPSPDGSGQVSELGQAVMGNSREPTFAATIRNNGFLVKDALFRVQRDGDLVMIVDQGRPAPDGNGNFGALNGLMPWINDAGEIAFVHNFEASLGGINDAAAMVTGRGGATPLRLAVRANQVIPNSGGDRFGLTIVPLGFHNAGEVAISNLTAVDEIFGIWRVSSQGAFTRIVGTGDPEPTGGAMGGGLIQPAFSQLGPTGQVAFHDVADTSLGDFTGIYRGASVGSIRRMARQLDAAPGGGRFATFFSLVPPILGITGINRRGEVAFVAALDQTAGGNTDNVGLYLGRDSGTIRLLRKGNSVPDGNGFFLEFGVSDLRVNDNSNVLFGSTVSGAAGGASAGIFLARPGDIRQIARLNQAAPGGGVFTSFNNAILALNNSDQVVFQATAGSADGLYMWDGGAMTAILREGQTIPGIGTVSNLLAVGSGTGGLSQPGAHLLNQLGEVVLHFTAGGAHRIGIWTADSLVFTDGFESGDLSAW